VAAYGSRKTRVAKEFPGEVSIVERPAGVPHSRGMLLIGVSGYYHTRPTLSTQHPPRHPSGQQAQEPHDLREVLGG